MFGVLLWILASEISRDEASEDRVWPAITSALKDNKDASRALLAGGQPTIICKYSLCAGVRKLHFRNLLDIYGKQEYFDTLKLQFGWVCLFCDHE